MLKDEGLEPVTPRKEPRVREPTPLGRAKAGEPFRVAVWADSHLATGAFTDELMKLLGLPEERVSTTLIPASMNRPGVRLPLRKSCVGAQWRYEPGHVSARSTRAIGPGLVNLFTEKPGASLAWDFRGAANTPRWQTIRILYEQTEAPLKVTISVDGERSREVLLAGPPGPATLALQGSNALSTVRLSLVSGKLRLLGLALPEDPSAAAQLELFAFPGATIGAWEQADNEYLAAWYQDRRYDLVMLAYGTNEGNVQPFDPARYEATLRRAVERLRARFPDSACVLVGPPDRGVLVRRSQKGKRGSSPAKGTAAAASTGLLRFSRVHAEISALQQQVAAEHGCTAWSMMEAMGGAGSAYHWAHATPPLMAQDLLHLTPNGYRELARRFAADLGWEPSLLGFTAPHGT